MNLFTYLKQNQITSKRFAKIIGVSRVSVERYKSGDRHPRVRILRKITTATDGIVTANDFIN